MSAPFNWKALIAAYLGAWVAAALLFAALVGAMAAGMNYALKQLIVEQDNRQARQTQTDKRLMLTVPHLWRGKRVEECRIIGEEIECTGHDKSGRINLTRSN